ncbi:DUF1152 domain-containing protein [Nocardia sp. NPDC058658]|uniref:DUF1152 domain-containing protein n=1 Tax=Nocardia sp. NPDC058658 TaxID=3346580 RepID=UPI0036676F4D
MTAIAIAAGGGGDAVTAAVLARKMPDLNVAAIMSYSWDRLLIDPTPGPRGSADFDGLIDRGGVYELTPTAGLRTGGQSTLPRLSQHIDLPILLMDISAGTAGLAHQISNAAAAFNASDLIVVDIGGDIVAVGHERGLRSPLADSVALAAAVESGLQSQVLVTGIGLDGELSISEASDRLIHLGAHDVAVLTPTDVLGLDPIWFWHPSEANGLLAAAATGWRGSVETQRNCVVQLVDAVTHVYQVSAEALAEDSLAALVASSTTLVEVEELLRARRGYSDIDIERNRLTNRSATRTPGPEVLAEIDRYAIDAAHRGIDALTVRRVIELAEATDIRASTSLRELLSRERPGSFQPPFYTVRPCRSGPVS